MGALGRIFSSSGGKLAARVKQAQKLLEQDKIKEATAQYELLRTEVKPEVAEADKAAFRELRAGLFDSALKAGELDRCHAYAAEALSDDKKAACLMAEKLADHKAIDPESLNLIRQVVDLDKEYKGLLLKSAKNLLGARGDNLAANELDFLTAAAAQFPLWKEGLALLSDRYLHEGRKDAEALQVYRNAYPNRKADKRLRAVLLDSLIQNGERDDFAAMVYRDAVETGENLQALSLLAQHHIERADLHISTVPYVVRALEKTKLPEPALKRLTELVLADKSGVMDTPTILLNVYKQGYFDRGSLTALSEFLAESGKFDNLAIEIMTRAFEQRVVNKRAILILTEHCLANDRDDDFAIRVYETYLSTWPDRPQRRIYGILAHYFAGLTKVDDQAQKIYEEALVDEPTDPVIVNILARAYHASDRRDEHADLVYRQAFPIADGDVKLSLARILAEIRIAAGDYSQETLLYLTTMGRPSSGPLANSYDEALTNCFLNAGRRGEQAQQSYYALFERTEHSADINPRLVTLLAELIKETGTAPEHGSVHMRVYRKLFELEKFTTDPEIAFVLLTDVLKHNDQSLNLVHLSVVAFEHDPPRFIEIIRQAGREALLPAIGDFHIERHNFPLAAQAYQASYDISPVDAVRYRLAKIRLLEGNTEQSLQLLEGLDAPEYAAKRLYWQAAASQQTGDPARAEQLLARVRETGGVPEFLLELRQAINFELKQELENALGLYTRLAGSEEFAQFSRWIQLEKGTVLIKLERLEAARDHLEEVFRHNPAGRAEQMFLSLGLFFLGQHQLRQATSGSGISSPLSLFTRAVEVNRNHRLLRQVIVDVLSVYGEDAFFKGDLRRAAEIFDVANRILPKRLETKIYLAYTYHRLKDYAKAIISYRDIAWTDEDPYVQRSQAYAYMENAQPEKAWHVFQDLARRGNLTSDDFPRLVQVFLADQDAEGGRAWEKIKLGDYATGLPYAAMLQHDGLFERSVEELNRLLAGDKDNPQCFWYLGQAYSHLGKREMAVHHWKRLLEICKSASGAADIKMRQLTEIGLAFLNAGYAQEAMQTWDQLRALEDKNPDLPLLYAATLDLNAYQMARKDQNKAARDEWKKALQFDQQNVAILQNYAIATMQLNELEEAERLLRLLGRAWQAQLDQNPRKLAQLAKSIATLERVINTFSLTKNRPDFDLTKIRAEDNIEFLNKANQFYWILSLDKRATAAQIEREYFRLVKIFNPERHAEDFMLVEESYTNLFKTPERREMLDTFAYNPVDLKALKARLSKLPADGQISFERLDLPTSVPQPDFQQLKPRRDDLDSVTAPLRNLLAISFRIPDWKVL